MKRSFFNRFLTGRHNSRFGETTGLAAGGAGGLPAGTLLYNGSPLTFNGSYLTYNPA